MLFHVKLFSRNLVFVTLFLFVLCSIGCAAIPAVKRLNIFKSLQVSKKSLRRKL